MSASLAAFLLDTQRVIRYLEDLMPKISYRPAPQRSTKKTTSSERDALSKELGSLQLDKTTTDSIRNVIMSDRIDYQVGLDD